MANQHGMPIWYELATRDPDASRAFYDAAIGWTVEAQPSGAMDYRMIDTGDGLVGGVMRLTGEMTAGGATPGWLVYFGVDDVDATVADVRAAGGGVRMPAMDLPDVGRMALLADPHGTPFYVMRGASDEDSTAFQQGDAATPGHAVWNELTAPDPGAAIAFYAGALGWRQEGGMPMGELGEYKFLHAGDTCIGAVMGRVPDGKDGWLPYFMASDIDAAATRVGEAGGMLVQGPDPIPGGSFALVAADPHGVRFGLVGERR